jgi:glutathione synthase/RimK-type ligase-like ATP-grasp enzyme
MKKIGILFGQENTFPQAFVDRINSKKEPGISAEFVNINKVVQGEPTAYDVIVDRISQDVPFYRGYLKNAALSGTSVINNPFWWSADEKFFNNALATKIGVAVPNTVLLPSNQMPPDTNERSFRNLSYPLDWNAIFDYVGFPAFFKPFSGGGWKNVYRVNNPEEFYKAYNETAQLVMMLQSEVVFTEYYRCYCIDRKDVHIMQYDPKQPHHLRYLKGGLQTSKKMLERLKNDVLKINNALGYDFNTVELAVKDGVPYAIDFCNPAPDADLLSVGEENFEWIVEAASNMAIRRAKNHQAGKNNLTWGDFIISAANK